MAYSNPYPGSLNDYGGGVDVEGDGLRIQDYLLVESVSDLEPYANGSGGYLLPSKLVVFGGLVDLGSGYIVPSAGTVVRGFADAAVMSTTAGGVLRCTAHAANLIVREVSFIGLGGSCVVLDGGANFQLNLFFCGLIGASAGTVTGWNVQSVKQCYIECADGITFGGTTRKVFVSETPFYGITGSAIRLDSTLNAAVVDLVTSFFKFNAPGVCLEAEVGYTVGSANLRGSLLDGTATPLVGVSPGDVNWTLTNNTDIANSRVDGILSITSTAVTDIVSTGVAVKVAGTTTPWSINQRFSHSNNRLTYTGLEPVTCDVDATFAVGSASNSQELSLYIAKNGTVITESRVRVRIAAGGDERNGAVTGICEFVTGDYVEIWVANDTSTADITALAMTLKAKV